MAQNARILVTGATGFIGRAVCIALHQQGFTVRAAARHAAKESIPFAEVAIIDDINSRSDWSCALEHVDAIIHLAAWNTSSTKAPVGLPAVCHEINVYGSKRLAEMAAIAGVKRIVYMSTVKVYGEGRTMAYAEKDAPKPADLYGGSKWQAEQVLQKIAGETGMELVILRAPLVYGPGVKENFLRLIKWVDRGVPLPLAGMKNKRSMVYVGNLADAIVRCIHHPRAAGETFLISDGCDISTHDLTEMIADFLGKTATVFYVPDPLIKSAGKIIGRSGGFRSLSDPFYVDIRKIKATLDWTPPFSLSEGLKETIRWYKTR